jgi:tetratricopeptide (TPR) repeat protein
MTSDALIGFGLGAAAALLALLILIPVGPAQLRPGGRPKLLAGVALGLPLLALGLFTGSAPPAPLATPDQMAAAGSTDGQADWSLLSHMYLGGPPPGTPGADAAAMPAVTRAELSTDELRLVTQREPGNAEAWFALANAHRQARDFAAAVPVFEKALKLDARNADAWADYADALASVNGKKLSGAPAAAIERALKLDPSHLKGLWLQASLDIERRQYPAALATWRRLRAALPAGSPDTGIIDANIAEAEQLAGAARSGG